ncbi:MAG: hypothetical protein ABIR32_22010 [Ilumatobacteraceae bacterium]
MTDTLLNTALWLERRLDLSLGFHFPTARMYGIVINDPEGLFDDQQCAARASFIDEHRDVYEMISGPSGVLARSFDAAAIVTGGWAAPVEEDGSLATRASRHPGRRRVRAVAVVSDDGIASVIRFEDEPNSPRAEFGGAVGGVIDALETMWFGEPTRLISGADAGAICAPDSALVNMRTTRGGCSRRP